MKRRSNHHVPSSVFLLVVTAFLLVTTMNADAASNGVSFSGSVPQRVESGIVQAHPNVIVSFGNEVAVPVHTIGETESRFQVFDETGALVGGSYTLIHPDQGNMQVIPLNRNGLQRFTICKTNAQNCITYTVLRDPEG